MSDREFDLISLHYQPRPFISVFPPPDIDGEYSEAPAGSLCPSTSVSMRVTPRAAP